MVPTACHHPRRYERLFPEEFLQEPESTRRQHVGCDIGTESHVPFVAVDAVDDMLKMLLVLPDCPQNIIVAFVLHGHQDKGALVLVG